MPKAIAKEVLGRPLEFTNGEELSNRLHQPLPPNEVSVYVLLCVGIGSGLNQVCPVAAQTRLPPSGD